MRLTKKLPPVAYLRQRFDYDPDTGIVRWKWYEPHPLSWNARYAGTATGYEGEHGHLITGLDRKLWYLHRIIWAVYHGADTDFEIDHINHDRRDNRIANLRLATSGMNSRNRSKHIDNRSGRTGVFWRPREQKWAAVICVNYRVHQLGYYVDLADAIAALEAAEIKFDFHGNHGENPQRRFPSTRPRKIKEPA